MRLILFLILFIALELRSQSFYETVMIQNISIADTSNDISIIEQSAGVFHRISTGFTNDWPARYYQCLTNIRLADLGLRNDTAYAKMKLAIANRNIKSADSLKANEPENKILAVYLKLIILRAEKIKDKKIKALEAEISGLQKLNPLNPRICTIYGYYNIVFYPKEKGRKEKTIELFNKALKLYVGQKVGEYIPTWGKKWTQELLKKIMDNPVVPSK